MVVIPLFITGNILAKGDLSAAEKLPPRLILALFALQLEMDAVMPIATTAYLRLEVEHARKHLESLSPVVQGESAVEGQGGRLLLAVVHGENLKPVMGSFSVDAFCRLTILDGDPSQTGRKPRVQETGYGKYLADGSATRWEQMFSIDLGPDIAKKSGASPLVEVACADRVMFMDVPLGDNAHLTAGDLLTQPLEVVEHTCRLSKASSSSSSPSDPVLIKFLSIYVTDESQLSLSEIRLKKALAYQQRSLGCREDQTWDLGQLHGRRRDDGLMLNVPPMVTFKADMDMLRMTIGLATYTQEETPAMKEQHEGEGVEYTPMTMRKALLLDVLVCGLQSMVVLEPKVRADGTVLVVDLHMELDQLIVLDNQVRHITSHFKKLPSLA